MKLLGPFATYLLSPINKKLIDAIRTGYCLMKKELDRIAPNNDYNRAIHRELKQKIRLLNNKYSFEKERSCGM